MVPTLAPCNLDCREQAVALINEGFWFESLARSKRTFVMRAGCGEAVRQKCKPPSEDLLQSRVCRVAESRLFANFVHPRRLDSNLTQSTSRNLPLGQTWVRTWVERKRLGLALVAKVVGVFGGPDRDRTDDLFHAMEARSQLRHRPTLGEGLVYCRGCGEASQTIAKLPGTIGLGSVSNRCRVSEHSASGGAVPLLAGTRRFRAVYRQDVSFTVVATQA